MNDIISFVQTHPTGVAMGTYWIFSAAISAMPMPDDKSGAFYKWLFVFAHTLAGSVARALATKTGNKNSNGNGNGWRSEP